MRRPNAFTHAELAAAFKAGQAAGVRVVLEVKPDGTRRVETFPLLAGEAAANDIDTAIEGGSW
jgi:hypothetical protein